MKRTAANSAFLKASKRLFNTPTYALLLKTMNTPGVSEEHAKLLCMNALDARDLPTDPVAVLASRDAYSSEGCCKTPVEHEHGPDALTVEWERKHGVPS